MTDYSRILARESEIEGREKKKKLVMRYMPNGLKNSNWGEVANSHFGGGLKK